MQYTVEPVDKLAKKLSRLPGIGAKSALRMAFHIISLPEDQVKELSDSITQAKKLIKNCSACGTLTQSDPCAMCSDPKRNNDILCVVKETRDVLAMEKMREFNGRYHVLGGVISPMDGVGPGDLNIASLIKRVEKEHVKEVVIATNLDIEGDATAHYLQGKLAPLGVAVSRIAYGVPVGGNLEYTDELTLMKAFEGRRLM